VSGERIWQGVFGICPPSLCCTERGWFWIWDLWPVLVLFCSPVPGDGGPGTGPGLALRCEAHALPPASGRSQATGNQRQQEQDQRYKRSHLVLTNKSHHKVCKQTRTMRNTHTNNQASIKRTSSASTRVQTRQQTYHMAQIRETPTKEHDPNTDTQ